MKKIIDFCKNLGKTKYVALAFLVVVAGGAVCAICVTQVALPSAKNAVVKTAANVSDKLELKDPDAQQTIFEVVSDDAAEQKVLDDKLSMAKVKKVSQTFKKSLPEEAQHDGLDLNLVKAVKAPKPPKLPDGAPKGGDSAGGSSGAAPKKEPGRIFFGEPEDFGLEELFKEPEADSASNSAKESKKPSSQKRDTGIDGHSEKAEDGTVSPKGSLEHVVAPAAERAKSPERSTTPEVERVKSPERAATPELERAKSPERVATPEIEHAKTPKRAATPEIERAKSPERATAPELERAKTPERVQSPEWFLTPDEVAGEIGNDSGHVEEDFILDWPTEKNLAPAVDADAAFAPVVIDADNADKKGSAADSLASSEDKTSRVELVDVANSAETDDASKDDEKSAASTSSNTMGEVIITDEVEDAAATSEKDNLSADEKIENAAGQADTDLLAPELKDETLADVKTDATPDEIVDEVLKQAAAEKESSNLQDKKVDEDLARELAKKKAREYVAALEAEAARKREQDSKPMSKLSKAYNWVKDKISSVAGSALDFIVDHKYLSVATLATALLGGTLYGASKLINSEEGLGGLGSGVN